ncbi:hypothetical protein [Paenibacillus polymyxa]|uniref:hypothetical protein n=1 Tax=Paenibacillus polymyxa TaxID=1406 RepID=UPI000B0D9ECB|nr:hypothetical protein [Paenibacillus polymyxa]
MSYRMEIDALNALVKEQQRTNELLEIIVKQTRGEDDEHENVKPIRSATRKTGK